ncbi:MAG: biopolymer transporter ExbD [Deltaproteobacteria bacterium]|nr:biopolymer transporter ExbD [Deltaproteobacteria bacterium]
MATKAKGEVEDINLIPIMNLFVTMIPLLLLTAAFYHIGMVNASVPTESEKGTDVATKTTAVTLNVRMTQRGFEMTASNSSLGAAELEKLSALVAKKNGDWDYERLNETLSSVKSSYPKSDTIILFPAKKSRYSQIVRTMDAARYFKRVKQTDVRQTLFPVVVIASLVE